MNSYGEFYLCLIEGRHFYYSPSSGKWRMKGKRPWLPSSSPSDFITMAKVYSPPNYHSRASQSHQQKTSTKPKKKKQQKPTPQKNYSSQFFNSDLSQDKTASSLEKPKQSPKIKTQTLEIPEQIADEVQLFVNLLNRITHLVFLILVLEHLVTF